MLPFLVCSFFFFSFLKRYYSYRCCCCCCCYDYYHYCSTAGGTCKNTYFQGGHVVAAWPCLHLKVLLGLGIKLWASLGLSNSNRQTLHVHCPLFLRPGKTMMSPFHLVRLLSAPVSCRCKNSLNVKTYFPCSVEDNCYFNKRIHSS